MIVALLTGMVAISAVGGISNPRLTPALDRYAVDYWPPHDGMVSLGMADAVTRQLPVSMHPRVLSGDVAHSYVGDYYDRIHISPPSIDLGILITGTQRDIRFWNAWRDRSQTLNDVLALDAEGITVTAPGATPLTFRPLAEKLWSIEIGVDGPPKIDAQIQWLFAGLPPHTVQITGKRLIAWTSVPNWANGISETLAWLTDVTTAVDASESRTPLRETPRRQWEFDALVTTRERQTLETQLYAWAARNWCLPVWSDISRLATPVAMGDMTIPVATAGLDFSLGGLVMLRAGPQSYEIAEVNAIATDHLELTRALTRDWPADTDVLPCRTAQLTDRPQLTRDSDRVMHTTVRFEATEPCDWSAQAPATMYRDYPVLDQRPDESQSPVTTFDRDATRIDAQIGPVELDDVSGMPRVSQSWASWYVGRADRATLRALLYWFAGRAQAVWLPTWNNDLTLTAITGSTQTTLTVVDTGLHLYLAGVPGRRHVRIERMDGQVAYRAVLTAEPIDDQTEKLTLDSAPGFDVGPDTVRQINWLMLARQAGDSMQIHHETDSEGVASVALTFVGLPREEPVA